MDTWQLPGLRQGGTVVPEEEDRPLRGQEALRALPRGRAGPRRTTGQAGAGEAPCGTTVHAHGPTPRVTRDDEGEGHGPGGGRPTPGLPAKTGGGREGVTHWDAWQMTPSDQGQRQRQVTLMGGNEKGSPRPCGLLSKSHRPVAPRESAPAQSLGPDGPGTQKDVPGKAVSRTNRAQAAAMR